MSKLFSPITLRNVTLKNRIVLAPMCLYIAQEDGLANDWHFNHYESRAIGQVGLITVEATAVTQEGRTTKRDLGIWDDAQINGLKDIVHRIQKHGSKAAIQLSHAGRKAATDRVVAPSPITFDDHSITPTQLTKEEIDEIIVAFKQAAIRAKECGFDCIQLHGAHGYLIHQFLSPLSNQRTDEYGEGLEGRFLFLRKIILAVREVWDGLLNVRVSATDYVEGGLTIEHHVQLAKWMKELDVDYIDVSAGGLVNVEIDVYPNYQVPYAREIKMNASLPTSTVGLITTGTQAEEILQNDDADLISIGRCLLRNPNWALEAAKELNTSIEIPSPYIPAWM